jgi:diacylglycerol O-acyltransferase
VDTEVDLDEHLYVADVPVTATIDDLERFAARLAETPLDRRRPLWEVHVAERLADGRAAVVVKVHHALAAILAAVPPAAGDAAGRSSDEI